MDHIVQARIDGLFTGQIQTLWAGQAPTAIAKTASTGPNKIGPTGFAKDAQADLQHHGGPEKAIHHYPADHYAHWIDQRHIPPNSRPALFGENISTSGLTEDTLCIGDIFELGTAIVQISQGRQPCWKLSKHTKNPQMAALFTTSGKTGWYYRVLQTGQASVGDQLRLLQRPQPEWSVRRVTLGRLTRRISTQDAGVLARMDELADRWRAAFAKMAAGDRHEDTSKRLGE